jgi:hypothetical protein
VEPDERKAAEDDAEEDLEQVRGGLLDNKFEKK